VVSLHNLSKRAVLRLSVTIPPDPLIQPAQLHAMLTRRASPAWRPSLGFSL